MRETALTSLGSARAAWIRLRTRYPRLRWIERWGISVASILSGLGTLFVFRRGLEYFPWFVGYLLLLWLAGVLFAQTRRALAARDGRVLWRVVDYTIQTLLHGLLLFLLPIYYASTTLLSRNVWFLVLLVAAVILTTVDPWYRAVRRWVRSLELTLVAFSLFASLNVAFPLIGLRSTWALLLSGFGSLMALTPVLRRGPEVPWRNAALRAGLSGLIVAVCLWWVRDWIPPAPLSLVRGTFAESVARLEPIQPVRTISSQELRSWGRLTAFTSVAAPAGLQEPISHVWEKDGRVVARMPLAVLRGGRLGGFRSYSWKQDLGEDPAGVWRVEVRTASDQLVGRIRLTVTP